MMATKYQRAIYETSLRKLATLLDKGEIDNPADEQAANDWHDLLERAQKNGWDFDDERGKS